MNRDEQAKYSWRKMIGDQFRRSLGAMAKVDAEPRPLPSDSVPVYCVGYADSCSFRGTWINEPPLYSKHDQPRVGGEGFPSDMPDPVIMVDKGLTADMQDVMLRARFWLISERAKDIFQSIDTEAFEFRGVELRSRTGKRGPRYWFCDIVRLLDAFDAESSGSGVEVTPDGARRSMSMWAGITGNAFFRKSVIGEHHIFRLQTEPGTIRCDQLMRDAIHKVPKLRGIQCSLWGGAL